MKQKIFLIILALIILLPSCKSPSSPDTDGVTTTGTISGTVTDASTGNPIAGASVSTQPTTLLVTTDAQGNFSISNVTPGSYTVSASASGYLAGSASVTVTGGQTAAANLALQPEPTTGTISGTVTEEGTSMPIAGASVSTQPATTTATSDAQGNYTISDVDEGSYTVTASASGYMDDSTNVTVTAGQTSTADLALQADYSGSWSGTTTQGREISFTVSNSAITQITFGFEVSGIYCTVSGSLTTSQSPPPQISGNTFTYSGTATDLSYTFNGTFDSPTAVSGTADMSHSFCVGSASFTWSATKD